MDVGATGMSVQGLTRWVSRSQFFEVSKTSSAVVYNIWCVRNTVIWLHKVINVDEIVKMIQRNIVDRVYIILRKKISREDRSWLRQLGMAICN